MGQAMRILLGLLALNVLIVLLVNAPAILRRLRKGPAHVISEARNKTMDKLGLWFGYDEFGIIVGALFLNLVVLVLLLIQ